jgi:pimeloyl-ACP methyl ester carboxylesterase
VRRSLQIAALISVAAYPAAILCQVPRADSQPGQLVDIGGYRIHLWCTGQAVAGRPTVVLSAGGGDFATDWSLVQRPLSDSVRVCSYDRPGYGWSDPGPYPRSFRQEAFELHAALQKAGEHGPYVVVGQSVGAFVVRQFAGDFSREVAGMVLVGPTNENGKLGYRGQFLLMRTLASNRPIPPPRSFSESPPVPRADADTCRRQAERSARIVRPYDQLRAAAQRFRVWALQHPACVAGQDDYFAESMALFYGQWRNKPHPLGDLPLTVVMGTRSSDRAPPPGLSESEWRSDSLRLDLSRLSARGRLINDSLSGHHVQLDNPSVVVKAIVDLLHQIR